MALLLLGRPKGCVSCHLSAVVSVRKNADAGNPQLDNPSVPCLYMLCLSFPMTSILGKPCAARLNVLKTKRVGHGGAWLQFQHSRDKGRWISGKFETSVVYISYSKRAEAT